MPRTLLPVTASSRTTTSTQLHKERTMAGCYLSQLARLTHCRSHPYTSPYARCRAMRLALQCGCLSPDPAPKGSRSGLWSTAQLHRTLATTARGKRVPSEEGCLRRDLVEHSHSSPAQPALGTATHTRTQACHLQSPSPVGLAQVSHNRI